MFNALSAVKFAVSGVVGIGTGKIVSAVIKNNVSPESLIDKVTIVAASWTLSGVVTTAAKKYTNEMIDEVYNGVKNGLNDFKHSAALRRINAGESTWEDEGLDQNDYRMDSFGIWSKREEGDTSTKFQPADGKYETAS